MKFACVKTEPATTAALGCIQCKIRIADQVFAGQTVERTNGNADRSADDTTSAIVRIRLREAPDDLSRLFAQRAAILGIGKHHLELVTTKPTDFLAIADDVD